MLSSLSSNLVFATPLGYDRMTLNRIQLFRYKGRKTVVVIVTNEGLIKNRILDMDFGFTQKELNRVSDYLNSEFSGCTIQEIRSAVVKQMSKERALYDILISKAVDLCGEALSFPGCDVIMSGYSELLGLPDLSDRIKETAKALEDKRMVVELLDELSVFDGVQVVVGSENPVEQMRELSIVLAPYKQGGRSLGSVGMIGLTRMDYARAIPMVDTMARFITSAISE